MSPEEPEKIPGEHIGFDGFVGVRVDEEVIKEARHHARKNGERYDNFSHYVRVALIRLNRQHRAQDTAESHGVEEAMRK